MALQAYKVVRTHAHEISGWTILSRLIYSRAPHLGGINGDVQSDLATMAFKNGEQLEFFHSRIIIIQQGIILSGETVSPTRLLLNDTKEFSKSNKLKAFIALNMTYLITFLENNRKPAVYTRGNIHGIYRYLETIGATKPLITSGHSSHHFGPSYSTNNYT